MLKINIDYNKKIAKTEDKIPSVGAATIPAINTKAADKLKTKTSEITNLATKANLNEKKEKLKRLEITCLILVILLILKDSTD